ncbi:hypothetical protein DPEC_G00134880 [Dallia pectoralis]|uniref:Uncharacterized protein n=1 Tax=Dallia pectoralis TaxID=75939 RepID=A0ACC2GS77_DALPE|nr:hypothetical protein DPEC_G00134880 [Dallia pectoralis]
MRILVTLLLDTLPMLGRAAALFLRLLHLRHRRCAAVAGLLRNRCFLPVNFSRSSLWTWGTYYHTENDGESPFICSMPKENGMRLCSSIPTLYEEGLVGKGVCQDSRFKAASAHTSVVDRGGGPTAHLCYKHSEPQETARRGDTKVETQEGWGTHCSWKSSMKAARAYRPAVPSCGRQLKYRGQEGVKRRPEQQREWSSVQPEPSVWSHIRTHLNVVQTIPGRVGFGSGLKVHACGGDP